MVCVYCTIALSNVYWTIKILHLSLKVVFLFHSFLVLTVLITFICCRVECCYYCCVSLLFLFISCKCIMLGIYSTINIKPDVMYCR